MSNGVALRAQRPRLWRAITMVAFALVMTVVAILYVLLAVRGPASDDDSSASFSGIMMAVIFAAVPWTWWEVAKVLRVIPLVTIEVRGLGVRFVKPALRTLAARATFQARSPIDLTHVVRSRRRGPSVHVYTAFQGRESVRFTGWAAIGDESLRAARDQLLGSGVALNIDAALSSPDAAELAPARLRSTLASRGALCVEPAPGAPVEAEFAVSGGHLTYAALGSQRRDSSVRWLKDDEVSGEVRGFEIGDVTTARVAVTFGDAAPGLEPKDHRELPGLTDHLVFVDDVYDVPCHVLPTLPVKAYEVLADPADRSRFVMRLSAGTTSTAAP